MADLNETPRGNRIRIAFFGLRNAGKSTLVNAFAGQSVSIVSNVPGTTTDPVSKAMEILPLGPCLITDTAGLDDVGILGESRVRKTWDVLASTDVAIWVSSEDHPETDSPFYREFASACAKHKVEVMTFCRGDSVEDLKKRIAALKLTDEMPGLLDGLAVAGDRVICVCPIDDSAPRGRLILPQVQILREALDRHALCAVVQPSELAALLASEWTSNGALIITDSQAFRIVSAIVAESKIANLRLTSFSILFARQKGDLSAFASGLQALEKLHDGDTVVVAEGCTHHRQCGDIGMVKIPKAVEKLSGGKKLNFVFASGNSFNCEGASLVVHCGGCMLSRREVLNRINICRASGVPIVNYGLLLATAAGLVLSPGEPLAKV